MWYDEAQEWIIITWLAASIVTWFLCYRSGYKTAVWVVPLTITAFWLGLYLGIEATAKGTFNLPIGVVARQWSQIWNDYCGDIDPNDIDRCNWLRDLMKQKQ